MSERSTRPKSLTSHRARAGVERGEELVLDEDVGAGEGSREPGLAGIGVADQRNGKLLAAALDLAFLAGLDVGELVLEVADAVAGEAAVHFELGFARPSQADAAALLPRQVGPHVLEPRQAVLEVAPARPAAASGVRARVAKMSRISSLRSRTLTPRAFEVAGLARRQVVVEDDDVGSGRLDQFTEFADLAGADVGADVDGVAASG